MQLHRTIAIATSAAALLAAPALAAGPDHQYTDPFEHAGGHGSHRDGQYRDPVAHGRGHRRHEDGRYHDPFGHRRGHRAHRALGQYCRALSHRHVKGMKGTPFSRCVTAMARLAAGGRHASPRKPCRGEPRKHVRGHRGTPFSLCVKAGERLLRDRRAHRR